MTIDVLFAGVPVREFTGSREWYTRLFGRPADVVAHEHEVMWRVTDTGWLYIVHDPERAGRSIVAISVRNVAAAVTDINARGLQCGPILPEGDAGLKSTINDPDGNSISLIEVAP
jgi:predicted enzyme related to lactoylglutathione lyase